jgi:CubicO group peptidase (beta-lactamase class C family)
MQLVESGKVDFDTPIRRYLPDFRVADEVASAQITVRHLLHHTSGLPEDSAFGPMLSNDVRDEALSHRVRALEDVQLSHGVGTEFEYTDANYDVLGLVVQTISGQSYESYIADHVFTPLGMRLSYTNRSTLAATVWPPATAPGSATPGLSRHRIPGPPCPAAISSPARRTSLTS